MIVYKKAGTGEIDLLTKTRSIVLRAANGLEEDADLSEIEIQTRQYYSRSLADGSHTAYLVFDEDRLVGAGGISYFRVMPTCHNPSGRKGYIMNMYTAPEYRRQGIAAGTLMRLIADARQKGITAVSLEATAAGRPLYEKFGFVKMNDEMELLL